jgi:hypothetical protein
MVLLLMSLDGFTKGLRWFMVNEWGYGWMRWTTDGKQWLGQDIENRFISTYHVIVWHEI